MSGHALAKWPVTIYRNDRSRWAEIRSQAHTQKNELKPWQKVGWVIPLQGNAEFVAAVAAMENVLDVYHRP